MSIYILPWDLKNTHSPVDEIPGIIDHCLILFHGILRDTHGPVDDYHGMIKCL